MSTLKTLAGIVAVALAGNAPTAAGPGAVPGFSPHDAIDLLSAGNLRFAQGRPEHRNTQLTRLADTAGAERPIATVLACADSRVPVERLFDRGIGDIFTIRVFGNLVGPDTAGSIEYAVSELSTPVVVVLGHRGCGAIRAAANPSGIAGSLRPMIDRIAPSVQEARASHGSGLAANDEAVRLNVYAQIERLITQSPIVAQAARSGQVIVTGAIYDIATGQIDWLGQHPNQASVLAGTPFTTAPIAQATPASPNPAPTTATAPASAPPVSTISQITNPASALDQPGTSTAAATPNTAAVTTAPVAPVIQPFRFSTRPGQANRRPATTTETDTDSTSIDVPRRRFVNVPTRDDD